MFAVIGAMAEFERALIVERVRAGLKNARAKGPRLGRPFRVVDREKIMQLQAEGMSLRQIAERLGIGYGTVRARLNPSVNPRRLYSSQLKDAKNV